MLIKSYLSNRKQVVHINNTYSSVCPVVSGVPQGSILGPLLFNIYLNDIVNISRTATFVIYADDTSIFFSGDNLDELIRTCNVTMDALHEWSDANYMRINEKKNESSYISPEKQTSSPSSCHYIEFSRYRVCGQF